MTVLLLFISLLSLFAAVWILTLDFHNLSPVDVPPVSYSMPVRRDGVVFVSDGSRGDVRDASIELTKLGYHVLIGVKSKEEARSFAYDQRKGLETIEFDIADPVTLASVINRLRQIRRDLDRPIAGLVINLADFIEDHIAEQEYVDIEMLDINYKSLVKGPTRLFQSVLDAIRYKTIDDREMVESSNSGLMITANVSTAIASARVKFDKIQPKSPLDGLGLRVVTVTSDLSEVADRVVCGSKCVMQESFINFIDSFRSDDSVVSNMSLSTVYSNFNSLLLDDEDTFTLDGNSAGSLTKADRTKSTRYITHPHFKRVKARGTKGKKEQVYEKQLLLARFRMIQQYINRRMNGALGRADVVSGDSSTESTDIAGNPRLSYTARAILHAIASPRPQLHYDEAAFLEKKKTAAVTAAEPRLLRALKLGVQKTVSLIVGKKDEL